MSEYLNASAAGEMSGGREVPGTSRFCWGFEGRCPPAGSGLSLENLWISVCNFA